MDAASTIDTSMAAPPKRDLRHARSERTHSRILLACRAALKSGDFQPTVRTIGRIAGAGHRTVWQHYPRIHDLYREALDEETQKALVALVLRDSAVSDQDRRRLVQALVFGVA